MLTYLATPPAKKSATDFYLAAPEGRGTFFLMIISRVYVKLELMNQESRLSQESRSRATSDPEVASSRERLPRRPLPREQAARLGERAARIGARGLIPSDRHSLEVSPDQRRHLAMNDRILHERFGDKFPMSKFVDLYGIERVLSDQEYTIDRAEGFESDDNLAAKQIEKLFLSGVNLGGWLGVESVRPDGDYEVHARPTLKFDDFSHRVDAMVDLRLCEPLEGDYGPESLDHLTIGFDITTGARRDLIFDKLTKHSNDRTRLPFGFSRIDYHFDGENYSAVPMAPRYTIGLGAKEVEQVMSESNVNFDKQGRPIGLKMFSPQTLFTRFKILDEIRQQNLLYIAMLPDEREHSPIARTADLQLSAVDFCLHSALIDCATAIRKTRAIPPSVFQENSQLAKPRSERDLIRDYIRAQSARPPVRQGLVRSRNAYTDSYSNLINCAREIEAATYAPPDSPEARIVAPFRCVAPQNRGFRLPQTSA